MKDATIEDRQNLLRSCWARGPYDAAQPFSGEQAAPAGGLMPWPEK